MDLVEVGIGGIFPARNSDGDEALFSEVVPQDVSWVRETLEGREKGVEF